MARKRVTDTKPLLQLHGIREWDGKGVCDEALDLSLGETAPSADLGGSNKYSTENFEDRSWDDSRVTLV